MIKQERGTKHGKCGLGGRHGHNFLSNARGKVVKELTCWGTGVQMVTRHWECDYGAKACVYERTISQGEYEYGAKRGRKKGK